MIVIIIKIINEQQLTTTMNHEPWTFFQWWWSYPSLFFFIFIFLRRRSYPSSLHLSILWSSPGGELLVVTVPHEWTTTKTLLNNNTEPWTFFSVMVVLPLTFFHIHFFEKKVLPFFVSFVNPLVFTRWKGPPGLHRGGAGRAQKSPMLGDSFSGTAGG